MKFTEQHTHEAFLLACEQLEDMTDGCTLFEILANPEFFTSEIIDLAEYLDCWDCYLFTLDGNA